MKIAVADNNGLKFTDDLLKHWQEDRGHEVFFERGASEHLAQRVDMYYVDTWDNNIHYLYKLYHDDEDHNRTKDWDNTKKPRIVVRALDWEVWIGWMRDQKIIDWVDNIIFIADHISKRVNSEVTIGPHKQKIIKPGVDLGRFTMKTTQTDGFQLGMVLGDMWWPKNHMAGLDIFTSLYYQDPRWRLHIRGQHEGGNDYWKLMYEYYLESRGIKDVVTLYPPVGNMNEWYEQIDILLHPGMKEAFCYAVGEAMAKGIPVVVNDFLGSHDIWEQGMRYKTHPEAVLMIEAIHREMMIKHTRTSDYAREYIEKHYSNERMFKEYDAFLGL